MSGLLNSLHGLHQQHKERREERRDTRQERHDRGGHHNDYDDHDNYGSQHHDQRPYQGDDDDRRGERRDAPQERHDRGGRHNDYDDHDNYGAQQHGQRPYQGDDDDRREERRDTPRERHDRGGRHNDYDDHDNYGAQQHGQRPYQGDDDDDRRRPQPYLSQGQGQGRGYAPPSGPPPSTRGPTGFASQGGLDRGDFASDADINRMVAGGEFDERQASGRQGYDGAGLERRNAHGRYDAPTGPPPGQAYGERANEYGRYDAPSGPPPGRGYQSQQSSQQSYGSGFGGGSDRPNQYPPLQTQGRAQYDSPQGPPPGNARGQGNTPAGGFSTSRDGEERHASGYGGPTNDRSEPPHRGEAASYYNQQSAPGQGDRYANLARLAQENEDADPELYRRATLGLQEKIQAQGRSRPPRRDDEDEDYKAHVDAHRKAYAEDDHGPMDADAIGAAAAMEAFKQTAAAAKSSKAPAGGFQAGKASGGPSSKPGRVAQEEEEEETVAERAGGSGGLQDKLMALAMSQAGKLFDKKNAGSSGGDKSQDKAQAMQSAAATAMQLFGQYQTKGKLDSSDMSKVMGLAMNLL